MKKTLLVSAVFVLLLSFARPAAAVAGTMHVTTPNGGESFLAGDTITVSWSSQNLSNDVSVTLELFDAYGNHTSNFANQPNDFPNSGSLSWMIPTNIPASTYYKVRIAGSVMGTSSFDIYDESDGYFSINPAASQFGATAPVLTKLNPTSGPTGTMVAATGTGFLATNTVSYKGPGSTSGSISNITNSNGTSLQFQIPSGLATGSYSFAVVNTNGSTSYLPFSVTDAVAQPLPALPHASGTNVLGPDGTVYFITQDGHRSPYTSAGAFLSYGFNSWAGLQTATSGDLAFPLSTYTPSGATSATTYFIPPRNGALINDKGTVYLITNGLRIGFASAAAFTGLGYSFSNVRSGDTSFMVALAPINTASMAHPDGTLVNYNGTIYIIKEGSRKAFPSADVFYSWGLNFSESVPANSFDIQVPVGPMVNTRLVNQLSI